MEKFSMPIQVRWSDIDQNRHLRHSAYYDFGTTVRVTFFSLKGLTNMKLEELGVGPILFREEAIFRKEIKFEDRITVDMEVTKAKKDFSRWSIRHHLVREDGVIAAVINMDGAWMNLSLRKLTTPDSFVHSVFDAFPKSADFHWI
ncbi:MAG TPA: acyl-CoA thioesterase [Cyclobacteriaceae bacterium]|nr:acyl-CoA thioesterase [Cyclobacteriaceae bacterium]